MPPIFLDYTEKHYHHRIVGVGCCWGRWRGLLRARVRRVRVQVLAEPLAPEVNERVFPSPTGPAQLPLARPVGSLAAEVALHAREDHHRACCRQEGPLSVLGPAPSARPGRMLPTGWPRPTSCWRAAMKAEVAGIPGPGPVPPRGRAYRAPRRMLPTGQPRPTHCWKTANGGKVKMGR